MSDAREVFGGCRVRVEGQMTVNGVDEVLVAAQEGIGFVPEDQAAPYTETGELEVVLADWSQPFTGFHLYYPSRRQVTSAFRPLVEGLRWRD